MSDCGRNRLSGCHSDEHGDFRGVLRLIVWIQSMTGRVEALALRACWVGLKA